MVLPIIVGAIIGGAAIPVVIAGLGFTGAGIGAGTVAANMMAATGPVAAASAVALMKSVGVVRTWTGSIAAAFFFGADVGGVYDTMARRERIVFLFEQVPMSMNTPEQFTEGAMLINILLQCIYRFIDQELPS